MKYVPLALLSAALVKSVISGSAPAEAFIIFSLAALYGGLEYMDYRKPKPINQQLLDRISKLEEDVQKTNSKVTGLGVVAAFKK